MKHSVSESIPVIQFHLPEGAYPTLMSLVRGLRAQGDVGDSKKWTWTWAPRGGEDQFGLIDGLYTYYQLVEDVGIARTHRMSFLRFEWLKRGEGLGYLVRMHCQDGRLWDIGVYRTLLDEIITIWPETKADIDRSFGVGAVEKIGGAAAINDGEPDEIMQIARDYKISIAKAEQWRKVRRLNEEGNITQKQAADCMNLSVASIKKMAREMKGKGYYIWIKLNRSKG